MARKDASRLGLAALVSAGLALGLFLSAGGWSTAPRPTIPTTQPKTSSLGAETMAFEPAEAGRFQTRAAGYSVVVGPHGADMHLRDATIQSRLIGARGSTASASGRLPLVVNRYSGSATRLGVHTYGTVSYRGVYPGIDLRYHGRNGTLEYDFVLAPHADARAIGTRLSGARSLRLRDGDLLITTSSGTIRQHRPVAFQGGARIPVRFVLSGDRVGFALGSYDHAKPLVIDPSIALADYIGGTGQDAAAKVAVDGSGNIYIVGSTYSSTIPGTSGSGHGDVDAFVMRLGADGSRKWITYIGGSGQEFGNDIALDGSGRPYVTGSTRSGNFPKSNSSALSGTMDAFVAALNTDGQLRYATYEGGTLEDVGMGIAVAPSGAAYVAVNSGTTTNNVYTSSQGFVQVLTANGVNDNNVSYSGSGQDGVTAVGLTPGCDSTSCVIYFAGHTLIPNPDTQVGGNIQVAYLYKWNFGTGLEVWHTPYSEHPYGGDDIASLAVDSDGNPAFIGTKVVPLSQNTNTNYAFAARFNGSNGAGEQLAATYATPSPVNGPSYGSDITYDAQGNMYLLAFTTATNGVKTDAVQKDNAGGWDADVVKYDPNGPPTSPGPSSTARFVWETFLGGSTSDYGYGIATDARGGTYVVGETGSGNFITKPATQPMSTPDDGFIVKIQTNPATITDGPKDTVGTRDVTFKYSSGETDGTYQCRLVGPSTPSPAFAACGNGSQDYKGLADGAYSFEIQAFDSGGTSDGTITKRAFQVDTTPHASFTIAPNPSLVGRPVSFDASGSTAATPITKYEWDLDGDGAFETQGGSAATASQVYPVAGTFKVTLRVTDSDGKTATHSDDLHVNTANDIGTQFGVTINKGAQFTNDPRVTVTSVFPVFTTSLLLSNDGGFGRAQTFPAKRDTAWVLDSSGPERLPKTIYVRFLTGLVPGETHQDDIILDETPPSVSQAQVVTSAHGSRVTAAALRKYKVKIKARDSNSGVAVVQVTANKKKPGKSLKYKTKLVVKSAKKPKWARARDRAGNWSKWKKMQ